jgi:hypothetical protein
MSAVDTLKNWFGDLPQDDKKEVVRFLYGGKALISEGTFFGPNPALITKGLFVGTAPISSQRVCTTCGRPL